MRLFINHAGPKETMADTTPQPHVRAIGENLRAVRQERQMSPRELADKAEISASMLSQIETGKVSPSVRSLYTIANVLEVSMDYFFPEEDNDRASSNGSNGNTQYALTASELRDAKVNGTAGVKEFVPHTESSAPVVHANTRPMIE